jgi:SAM-dependent methyltransferase
MDDPISSIRENYNRLAKEYAAHVFDELQHKPLDRELLDRFASEVRGRGRVCDMGCGPGQVARYLADMGVSAFGLDLSPGLLEEARGLNPDLSFQQGDMTALDIPSASLAGITAFYAIVNIPEALLPQVFAEMHRVLRPGGTLLVAFHIGSEQVQPDELWGVKIEMGFFFFPTKRIAELLDMSGFQIQEIIEREPYPEVEYPSRRAYIFARKQ